MHPVFFSDWDEPYYLSLLKAAGSIPFNEAFQFEHGTFQLFHLRNEPLPHALLDFVFGKLLSVISLSPTLLAVLLDYLCVLAAMFTTIRICRLFQVNDRECFLLTTVSLVLPWLSSLQNIFPWDHFGSVSFLAHTFYPTTPVLRAIYTQVSFVVFLYTIEKLLEFLVCRHSYWRAATLGFLIGISLYLYFFAWGVLFAVTGCATLLLFVFTVDRVHRLQIFLQSLLLFTTASIISLPGVLALLGSGSVYRPGPQIDQEIARSILDFSSTWFIAPLYLIILFYSLYKIKQASKIERSILLPLIVVAAILAELVLMNLQPLLGRWMVPYHFSLFFIHPLLSVLFLIAVTNSLHTGHRAFILNLLFLVALCVPIFQSIQKSNMMMFNKQYQQLFVALKKLPDTSIAVMPFDKPFQNNLREPGYLIMPYWIKTLSAKQVIGCFMSFSSDRISLIEEEFDLSLLYSGDIKPLTVCPSGPAPLIDLLTGASSYHIYQRTIDCMLMKQRMFPSSCQIAQRLSAEYLLWDKDNLKSEPRWIEHAAKLVWSGEEGRFKLYQIDRPAFAQFFCN